MKVLVWQTAYLGDVVLSTSLLEALRKNNIELFYVGKSSFEFLIKPLVDEYISYDKHLSKSFNLLKKINDLNIDIAFSLHRSLRTALLLKLSNIKEIYGYKESEGAFLYTKTSPFLFGIHEIERINLLARLYFKDISLKHTYLEPPKEDFLERVKDKFNLPNNFIAVLPFSNFYLKEWAYFNDLITLLVKDFKVVILGDKSFDFDKRALNLSAKTDLNEFISILYLSDFVISNDSSGVHIANAFNKKAFSIYTSTSPYYGFYPLIGGSIQPEHLSCSPCSPNPKRCKVGFPICKFSLKSEEVYKFILENL